MVKIMVGHDYIQLDQVFLWLGNQIWDHFDGHHSSGYSSHWVWFGALEISLELAYRQSERVIQLSIKLLPEYKCLKLSCLFSYFCSLQTSKPMIQWWKWSGLQRSNTYHMIKYSKRRPHNIVAISWQNKIEYKKKCCVLEHSKHSAPSVFWSPNQKSS